MRERKRGKKKERRESLTAERVSSGYSREKKAAHKVEIEREKDGVLSSIRRCMFRNNIFYCF